MFGSQDTETITASDVASPVYNKYELRYKGSKVEIGTQFHFRILSMKKADLVNQTAYNATLKVNGKTIKRAIPNLGPEILAGLVDHEGKEITACPVTSIIRVPVWAFFKQNRDGTKEEINKLQYIEMTPALFQELMSLPVNDTNVDLKFTNGRPEYNLWLRAVKSNNSSFPKNYEIAAAYGGAYEKFVGVPAEKVLANQADQITAEWPELQEAMRSDFNVEAIKEALSTRTGGGSSTPAPPSGGFDFGGDDEGAGSESPIPATEEAKPRGKAKAKVEAPETGTASQFDFD